MLAIGKKKALKPLRETEIIMNILVVDEARIVLKILGDFIEDLGHQVTCFDSIEAVIKHAGNGFNDTDLILIDTRAPKGQDARIIQKIHSLFPSAYTIIISDDYSILPFKCAVSNKVFAYLKKPVRLGELELAITRVGERCLM